MSPLASGEPAGEGGRKHPVLVLVFLALVLSFILTHMTASCCLGRVARGRRWRKGVIVGSLAVLHLWDGSYAPSSGRSCSGYPRHQLHVWVEVVRAMTPLGFNGCDC